MYSVSLDKVNHVLANNWRPPSLSELTPMIFVMGLTHLGSEASNSFQTNKCQKIFYSDKYLSNSKI